MGNEQLNRKTFLKNLAGLSSKKKEAKTTNLSFDTHEDVLFEKYSRKSIGNRHYSQQEAIPSADGTTALRVGNVNTGLNQYTGVWTAWEAMYLLRRINFGVKKADVDNLVSLGMSSAVDNILNFTAPVNPSATPVNYYQASVPDSNNIPLGGNWTTSQLQYQAPNDGDIDFRRLWGLQHWLWGVCINDTTNIREKMMQFWYHLIPINGESVRSDEGNGGVVMNDYISLLRNNSLGNFKSLIKSISKSPAMLVYLGGQYSNATTPNENFARELLELFTMGKVPTQNYTEADIQAASKIFSGWVSGNFYGGSTYPFVTNFNPSLHNQSNKTFSSFFGNTTIANQAGAAGANEFDAFFDMLFTYQATTIAKYICRRLYRFFVYYDIDNNVETNIITPLANFLIASNWEMLPTMKKLLKSEHFFDVVNRGVTIKSPIDYITGMIRTLKINTNVPTGANQLANQHEVWSFLQYYSGGNLEQGFLDVPNVSGWKAYYQFPTYYQNWINSNTIQQRSILIEGLLNSWWTFNNGQFTLTIDPIAFVQQFDNAIILNPVTLIDTVVQYLFAVDLPATFKAETKTQTLLSNQTTDYYWTSAWNNYYLNPTNLAYKNIVLERLKAMLSKLMQLSEFQLI